MRSPGHLPGVTRTALGVAMMRAAESRRDDRLFDDPLAQAFADAFPGAFPEAEAAAEHAAQGQLASLGAVFYASAVLRIRFFDDYRPHCAVSMAGREPASKPGPGAGPTVSRGAGGRAASVTIAACRDGEMSW